jgi:hypothetical protein
MDHANIRTAIGDKLSTEHRRLKKQTQRVESIGANNVHPDGDDWIRMKIKDQYLMLLNITFAALFINF